MFFIVYNCIFIFINIMLAGFDFSRRKFHEGVVHILLGSLFTLLLIQGLLSGNYL